MPALPCGCTICRLNAVHTAGDPLDPGAVPDSSGWLGASTGPEAITPASKPIWTVPQIVSNLTRTRASWPGSSGAPTVVTYGFITDARAIDSAESTEARGFSPFSAAQRDAARIALQHWADVANISFVETADASGGAQIRFANTTSGPSQAWTYGPGIREGGDVWINPNQPSNGQLAPGQYGQITLVHEIGHALGLSHPGEYNIGSGNPTFESSAAYAQDTRQYTVMSYWDAANSGASHGFNFAATPLVHDIAAIQSLYGARPTTRTGNTTYGFGANTGLAAYDFSINRAPVVTLYDSGGIDTLNLSGYSQRSRVDLNEGAFSDAGGLTGNVSIALGSQIENALSGPGSDDLIGNGLANWLDGGAGDDSFYGGLGNDAIIGGPGTDVARFNGAQSQYVVTRTAASAYTVVGPDGVDQLDGIEYLQFGTGPLQSPDAPLGASMSFARNSIVWQHDNGTAAVWRMNGLTPLSLGDIPLNPGGSWFAAANDDFYGDGLVNILWRNVDGSVAIWKLWDQTIVGGDTIPLNPGASWRVAATADMNADRRADILWQHTDGSIAIWYMNGTSIIGGGVVGLNPGPAWHARGVGNFFGDGQTGVLWQHDDGSVAIWRLSGSAITAGHVLGINPGPAWRVKGAADFNRDGRDDILWQHDSGAVAVWTMDGATITGGGSAGQNPGPAWHVRGTGDFSRTGRADILWQHDNGNVVIWEMSGSTVSGGGAIGIAPGPSWHVIGNDQMRFINYTTGNDLLAATPGSDVFVLSSYAPGGHAVTGFAPGQDYIELSSAQFADFATIQASSQAYGGGTLIWLDGTSNLLLAGVDPTALQARDFILV